MSAFGQERTFPCPPAATLDDYTWEYRPNNECLSVVSPAETGRGYAEINSSPLKEPLCNTNRCSNRFNENDSKT